MTTSVPAPVAAAASRPPAAAPDSRLSALSLLDEAAHRLRAAPAATLGVYYAGSLPFVLALLYFWADMSRSADAASRSAGLAFGLAILFVVMKTAQTVFAARIRAQVTGQAAPRWSIGRLARVATVQACWQPTGLFVLPVAVALFIPLGWADAFYQNLTALGDGSQPAHSPLARAWRHTLARPGQNHAALSVFWGLQFFAWLALMVAMLTIPALVKMFTGADNFFTRSGSLALLNSTFLAVSVALVYLALDPLAKTFYVLRCFYADAEVSGEDLLSELRALPPVAEATALNPRPAGLGIRAAARVPLAVALLAIVPLAAGAASENAADVPPPVAPSAPTSAPAPPPGAANRISPAAMDRSIHDVLGRREFSWRNPRQPVANDTTKTPPASSTQRFLDDLGRRMDEMSKSIRRWFEHDDPGSSDAPAPAAAPSVGMALSGFGLRAALYAVIFVCALLGTVLLFRAWHARRGPGTLPGRSTSLSAAALPDLADEAVLADQFPEDEWLALARRLLACGERRLALRALYLSALSNLGAHGLLGIARHKSNRDYLGELRRRARDRAGVQETFGRLVARFERVWYGSHPADDGLLADFQDDRARLAAEFALPNSDSARMAAPLPA